MGIVNLEVKATRLTDAFAARPIHTRLVAIYATRGDTTIVSE